MNFIIASGMSERSFCIFLRIHVRLTSASQVAYECFFSPPLVTKTDTWIRTLRTSINVPREWSNWNECRDYLQFQPRKENSATEKRPLQKYFSRNKRAEGAADGMPPPKQQQEKAVSANIMEKQRLKSDLPRTMFQQKKRAEKLANGKDVLNAALEKLGYKVKKKRSSRPLQRLQATKLRLGLPNALNKNQSFPHVLCAIRYQSRSKLLLLSKCNSKRISNLKMKSASVQLLS